MNVENLKTNLDWALYYRSIGWSPFPVVKGDKIPLVKWEKYQTEIATEEEIRNWWRQYPDASIGIATGKVSGIVVVDVEAGGSTKDLPATVVSRTGGGGFHFFYKDPGVVVKNRVRIREKTDVRGTGGYIVAAPSLHKSGNRYEWSIVPGEAELEECPQWVLEKTTEGPAIKPDWRAFLATTNPEGTRNQRAASLTGKVLHHLPLEMWDVAGWAALKDWNATQNIPPLAEDELKATWDSIKKTELEKRTVREKTFGAGKRNSSDKLINIIDQLQEKITLFHNELKDPYVQIPIGEHHEIWSCKNKMFKRWLAKTFRDTYRESPNSEAISTALNVIEGRATFDGPEHALHNRVAWHEGAIWYDLADSEWRVIKVTPDGWQVLNHPPILFRRYAHQQAQVEPTRGGDIRILLNFVNIQDEDQKILLLVWVVSCFVPDFPHPIPNFYGAQGSAKSLLCKLLRKIIDPSALEVASFPNDANEFVQILAHHYCIFFDNVSRLPDQVSDTLCKAVTGDGFSKRELYSDDDDIIFAFKRCLGLNGINLAAKNPDLLERSILFGLERVPPTGRRQERELLKEFENERPRIVGGILDAVAKAMQIKPSIQLDSLPRMADFVSWGCAIAEALGYTKEQFLDAYYRDIKSQNEEVLYESLVATAVMQFMETNDEWSGSPSELLKELTSAAEGLGINVTQEKEWPKAANVLSRRLNSLKTNFADAGIKIGDRTENKRRLIYLHKDPINLFTKKEFNLEGGGGEG